MQLVYEFGAGELEPVVRAIQYACDGIPYSVRCRPNDSDTYEDTKDSLSSAALKLNAGSLASFSLHPISGLIRYALVICPHFAGERRSAYMGTLEYLGDDYKTLWDLFLSVPGLSFACLGFEEGVELDDSTLSVDTFPWNQWPLVVGALRDRCGLGQWTMGHGPEMRWFTKAS